MIPRRGGTPLRVGAPSLETSNQTQIDDLVQRNRTLEHTVKKLSDHVALEAKRSKEAVATIREQWLREQQEWREGCDVLQSCHRIVRLRNVVELENERKNALKELDAVRKEKLKRLQRDFRITMFQVKEAELERRIHELENENQSMSIEYEERIRRLKVASAEYAAQIKAKDDELAVAEQEKEEFEDKLNRLREQHARSDASAEMLTSKLERTMLQLDGAQTKTSDLERANEELKRTHGEIQRQLAKWQNLETKGDQEVETLRKRRIELEVQVKELETRVEKNGVLSATALEKEQRRVEKLKRGVAEWQAEAAQNEAEAGEARQQFEKAQKQVEQLKVELEVQRARVRSSSLHKRARPSHDTSEDEVAYEVSLEQESSTSRAPAVKPKPRSRQAKSEPRGRKAAETDGEPVPPSRNDVEEAAKLTKAKVKAKAVDDEVRVINAGTSAKQHGKRKASSRDTPDAEIIPTPPKGKKVPSRAASEARGTGSKSKPRKEAHRGGSVQPALRLEEDTQGSDTADTAPKKKKRRINIFPTNAEPSAFNFMPQIDNGLNIPTILSPVKESEGIPSRSTSGSVIGSIGSMLKNSFVASRR